MTQHEEAEAAFEKIINNGRTLSIKKTAKTYWAAYNSDKEIPDSVGTDFEKAISSIPIDYRSPTVKPLEELNNCKKNNDSISSCYLTLAISLVDRIVKQA
ncbi:MAG: hypothetical protein DIZ80_16685 [endosymbiont of Galathealinum brachiosum]|uniref:Uncharacterized protein n=1 Tax=endosymbiont of Galathealinum brachiosum TaxID=2200906 RepID=A0A370D8Z6_9GAMM|nr:MAG: hypothetical protein DIZ80_16685 [endosymbiont of Galathealinum brachiosum]